MYNLEEKDELQCFKSFGKKVKLLDIFIYYTKMFNLIDETIYRIYCFQIVQGENGIRKKQLLDLLKIRKNKNNVDKQNKYIRTKVQNKMVKFNRNVLNHKNIFVLDSRVKRQNCETGYI